MKTLPVITEYFCGPGTRNRSACVCVQTITFELSDLWPRYLARWFTLTDLGQVPRSRS